MKGRHRSLAHGKSSGSRMRGSATSKSKDLNSSSLFKRGKQADLNQSALINMNVDHAPIDIRLDNSGSYPGS